MFLEASRRLEGTDPESTYRFFPTWEPWMWEQLPTEQEASTGARRSAGFTWPQDEWRRETGGEQDAWRWGPVRQWEGPSRGMNIERVDGEDAGCIPRTQICTPDQGWSHMASRQHQLDEFPQGENRGEEQALLQTIDACQ